MGYTQNPLFSPGSLSPTFCPFPSRIEKENKEEGASLVQ